jgi:pimeloyl-ACP methyl ester carboxylesterase
VSTISPLPHSGSWRDRPLDVRPTVLILGGFLTVPPLYRPLARLLMAHGAAGVVIARVWTPDWLIAAQRGCGAIATRSGKALLAAGRLSADVSGGAPVLVVGHSAGGLIARLLTAPEPLPGKRFGAAPRIGAIVTLGSPHSPAHDRGLGRRIDAMASAVAEAAVPGAYFAPEVGYVSVTSRAVRGDPAGTARERVTHLLYRSVIGQAAVPGTQGDGLVPVAATTLAGARQVVIDGAVHGAMPGTRWYGSEGPLDVWWPVALDVWRSALLSRLGRPPI